ncbi:Rhamnogalacturonate lyase [Cytospora mali]|uniref:Rhamnogalacturonate lyase n=1 Tax=Cytospora mali TaxID=578113 RepID=A0A194UR92_CYTMA|nr:Rhamnogalacturonate lyase [Valsa mali var. pyri (nom. inval.)]
MRFNLPVWGLALYLGQAAAKGPFLTDLGNQNWIFGNDLWNVTEGPYYATKLFSTILPGHDLVGSAYGHYVGIDGENNLEWTSASIVAEGPDYIDIAFSSTAADFHWVVFDDLQGAYQYIVNKATPEMEILRSLWRLDNQTFTRGRTNIKDDILPPFDLYGNATKVQDETWRLANGTYITKYDWSNFVRDRDFYGIYGPDVAGSWWIHPTTEYFTASQLSQTLTVHRESATGDSVQLNVFQDTSHFRVGNDTLSPVGKIWGPWLWYLNNGSVEDVAQRRIQELEKFPYSWLNNTAYHTRGSITGSLKLSDGRLAAGASVFLGDTDTSIRPLVQGSHYYYTTTAATDGSFSFPDVRTGSYGLYAWSNGGELADVYTNVTLTPISVEADKATDLGELSWQLPSGRTTIFQLGAFDKKSLGFKNSGLPYQHGTTDYSPANLTFTIGTSDESTDWYYAISALGTWTIEFEVDAADLAKYGNNGTALLSVSFASYSPSAALDIDINGYLLGSLSKDILAGDPALYRSGRISGEWRFFQYEIDASKLVAGVNTVGFTVTRYVQWRGFQWDSIFLEWQN